MEKLLTTKTVLKALYACASKEEGRSAVAGFFILPDRTVYSTDGRRLVMIKHDSFEKFELGNYEFQGKPVYNKNFGEVVIEKGENVGPDISLVIKDMDKAPICSHVFELSKFKGLNLSKLICKIFDKYHTAINYELLDFFPDNECFDVTTKALDVPDRAIKFTLVKCSGLEFSALVMPIKWKD